MHWRTWVNLERVIPDSEVFFRSISGEAYTKLCQELKAMLPNDVNFIDVPEYNGYHSISTVVNSTANKMVYFQSQSVIESFKSISENAEYDINNRVIFHKFSDDLEGIISKQHKLAYSEQHLVNLIKPTSEYERSFDEMKYIFNESLFDENIENDTFDITANKAYIFEGKSKDILELLKGGIESFKEFIYYTFEKGDLNKGLNNLLASVSTPFQFIDCVLDSVKDALPSLVGLTDDYYRDKRKEGLGLANLYDLGWEFLLKPVIKSAIGGAFTKLEKLGKIGKGFADAGRFLSGIGDDKLNSAGKLLSQAGGNIQAESEFFLVNFASSLGSYKVDEIIEQLPKPYEPVSIGDAGINKKKIRSIENRYPTFGSKRVNYTKVGAQVENTLGPSYAKNISFPKNNNMGNFSNSLILKNQFEKAIKDYETDNPTSVLEILNRIVINAAQSVIIKNSYKGLVKGINSNENKISQDGITNTSFDYRSKKGIDLIEEIINQDSINLSFNTQGEDSIDYLNIIFNKESTKKTIESVGYLDDVEANIGDCFTYKIIIKGDWQPGKIKSQPLFSPGNKHVES